MIDCILSSMLLILVTIIGISACVKSFQSHKAHRAALISVFSARHQFTLPDRGYGASASHGVPVYVPAFTGTYCTYPRRDGQAELTWNKCSILIFLDILCKEQIRR